MAQSTPRFTSPLSTVNPDSSRTTETSETSEADVPAPRGEPEDADTPATADTPAAADTETPAAIAAAGIEALTVIGTRLQHAVDGMDDAAMRQPSTLPGWTRAHLVSHLARNADALCNLLLWARTDVEQHAYASDEGRDADIAEGASRLPQVIREDLAAAHGRFLTAARAMPEPAWRTAVANRHGNAFVGYLIPWLRVMEELVHLVDLDVGETFAGLADLGPDVYARVIGVAAGVYRSNPDTPSVRLRVAFADGHREYQLQHGDQPQQPRHTVEGRASDVLGWLTGRCDGAPLSGDVPALPGWLR